jgi:CTP synthase
VGCQFHPEFKSRPHSAHPLFARFVRAALERQRERSRTEKAKPGEATAQTPQNPRATSWS